jgi:exodeoxyribonuclease VII large subunit
MQSSQAMGSVRVESILIRERNQLRQRQQRVDDLTLGSEVQWRARHRRLAEALHGLTVRLNRQDVLVRSGIARERLTSLNNRLVRAQRDRISQSRERETAAARQLNALSPLAVLRRGYALVYDEHGVLIKDTENITEGQSIIARLARGRIRSRVTAVEKEAQGS